MIVVRVYLKSGQHFDVCAEAVNCEYSGLTGELISFNYTGAVSGIPVYLDVGKVEAVVQLKACGGGDDASEEV
nr:MAG TPA: hypothetical protein [Caudoviricetes sp.]